MYKSINNNLFESIIHVVNYRVFPVGKLIKIHHHYDFILCEVAMHQTSPFPFLLWPPSTFHIFVSKCWFREGEGTDIFPPLRLFFGRFLEVLGFLIGVATLPPLVQVSYGLELQDRL